ncbi:unnamed protein product [Lupinus luteus]|uniref:Polygalacturonase n=1 Tax=Lupinus luteus TaxID=3873 RepID=A0AAV1WMK8_LUPLU
MDESVFKDYDLIIIQGQITLPGPLGFEDKHIQTRLMSPNHEQHFGFMMRRSRTHMSQGMVNVDHYGAIANDGRDDTEAFEKAWIEACSRGAILVVPQRSVYHLKPITFKGSCQPNTAFKVYGTIKAWPHMSAYEKDRQRWIMFDSITNLVVDGGGIIDGNGRKWWQNSCKVNRSLGGRGYAKDIKFMNMSMRNVTNPIIIDQNYCDQEEPCQVQESAVALSNVVYQNIKGTSASEVAIKFVCSKTVPCKGIYMQDVILRREDGDGVSATCENVRFANRGRFYPQCSSG